VGKGLDSYIPLDKNWIDIYNL